MTVVSPDASTNAKANDSKIVFEVYLINNKDKFQQGLRIFSSFERAVQFLEQYIFETKAKLHMYLWLVDNPMCPILLYERLSSESQARNVFKQSSEVSFDGKKFNVVEPK